MARPMLTIDTATTAAPADVAEHTAGGMRDQRRHERGDDSESFTWPR